MRLLIRPPAVVARVLGPRAAVMAEPDGEGWYEVAVGVLYWVKDDHGRESHIVVEPGGATKVVDPIRAGLWAALIESGASDAEAERLSR